jgi:hypothetical protein
VLLKGKVLELNFFYFVSRCLPYCLVDPSFVTSSPRVCVVVTLSHFFERKKSRKARERERVHKKKGRKRRDETRARITRDTLQEREGKGSTKKKQ